jgi:hypothetical protein
MKYRQVKLVNALKRQDLEDELNKVLEMLAKRDCPIKDIQYFVDSGLNAAILYEEET